MQSIRDEICGGVMHLFYVHSNITYRIAMAVIREKKIHKSEIIFVLGRRYGLPEPAEVPTFEDSGLANCRPTLNVLKSFATLRRFDRLIRSHTGNLWFDAYVPQTTIPFVELLVKHALCREFSYLEEGVGSYQPPDFHQALYPKSSRFVDRLKKLVWQNRIGRMPFLDLDNCKAVYCVNENAFPGARAKHVLTNAFSANQSSVGSDSECGFVLVMDGFPVFHPEVRYSDEVAMKKGLERLLANQNFDFIAVKFHPAQEGTDGMLALKAISSVADNYGVSVRRLPPSFDLECCFATSPPMTVLTLCSSSGFYAKAFGHDVVTYLPYFLRELNGGIRFAKNISYMKRLTSSWRNLS